MDIALKKTRDARRCQEISKMISRGVTRDFIKEMFLCTDNAINRALKKFPATVGMEEFKDSTAVVPISDESEILKAGLIAAKTKIAKHFIKIAQMLEQDRVHPGDVVKQIVSLYPIVKSDYMTQRPTNINFFVNNSETNQDDIERKMLEYATGQSKKPEEEK